MRTTTVENLVCLQKNPKNIRNICILAHVDHGKTTLADALVASNGIISQRMAGKLRYMDSREDEQQRGITMKSSAISLSFDKGPEQYLINLIDSPGHVDFSSEVSTAVRLCDGAVVVVDVVEGVCPQTHAVLKQAWIENIKPVLVLNKIDRLILELKMEPLEAFFHLQQIMEQINIVTSELFTSDMMEKTSNVITTDQDKGSSSQSHEWTTFDDELEDEKTIFFAPDRGNVVFASAYDGWGFTVGQFAEIFSKKLGISRDVLNKTLWGDFYLNGKTKRIMKGAQMKVKKPLFVQFILENLWSVYEAVCVKKDKEMTEKIVKSLDLKIHARDARHSDRRVQLQAITSQWLPVSKAVLDVVVDKLPSPLEISDERVEKLMCSQAQSFKSFPKATQNLKDAFMSCDVEDDAPVIVFVSKMFAVNRKSLPENQQKPLSEEEIQKKRQQALQRHKERLAAATMATGQTSSNVESEAKSSDVITLTEEVINPEISGSNSTSIDGAEETDKITLSDQVFIAFARVYSGTVRKGQKLYVLGPKHDPSSMENFDPEKLKCITGKTVKDLDSETHITEFTAEELYLFMGRELENMDRIPAGNILGIGGLENHILKSATVSSTVMCPAFTDLYFDVSPIVRVALEPKHPVEMKQLVEGLKLLNQADPCVQVLVQETGEHVIITAGEVHLERCLDDLRKSFSKIEINVSPPIVPFRETIIPPPKVDMVNEVIQDQSQKPKAKTDNDEDEEVIDVGLVEMHTSNKKCCVRIRALPLPEQITKLLEENTELLKTLHDWSKSKSDPVTDNTKKVKDTVVEAIKDLKENLRTSFDNSGPEWANIVENIWAFGPRHVGQNILVNRVDSYDRPSIWSLSNKERQYRDFDNSIVSGFQMATLAGPLCEEPMRGVCFIIEKWEYTDSTYSTVARLSESDSSSIDVTKHENCLESSKSDNESEKENNSDSDNDKETEIQSKGQDSLPQKHVPRKREVFGPFSGQLISCVKMGCRKSFQNQPQRLMVAMYKCNIQATTEVLGKLYAVLGKRNGSILEGDMREGSQSFNVVATLPVIESFGFADVIRKKTSGLASPQLVFSHWEVLDVDPFWVPTTEEEYLHFGEKADSENRARYYMNLVRKRKGLKVDEKIVEHAEKQRTLTRNK